MEIRLHENIRRLRREAGYTQEQLAEALGVSVSAVHKWEAGKAAPELTMLVEIAEFFETSVDALLDYGWEKLSMGQTVDKLRAFRENKALTEGIRFAEKALQKYPNSFDIVRISAQLYFLTTKCEYMPRAIELYEKSLRLIDQNISDQISAATIQNSIAYCYAYMDRMDDSVALLKKNNVGGMNNVKIGLFLSQQSEKADEALEYLSDALDNCYSQLYEIGIGYANAYGAREELDRIYDLILWLYQLGNGLRDVSVVNWMDRGNVRLFTILAEVEFLRGNGQSSYEWLKRAWESARKFDAAPDYRIGAGMKFYHGSEKGTAYDDMGDTAMEMIERYMSDEFAGKNLRPMWEKICAGEGEFNEEK